MPSSNDDARKEILGRIRQARGASDPAAAKASIDSYVRARARGPVREMPGDLVERFIANATAQQTTCVRVPGARDVPAAVAGYLRSMGLPAEGCVWPALSSFDWAAAGLRLEARGANGDDPVGVTGAFAALAETGTLMLLSAEDTPPTVSLLPETHVAVLAASRVVAVMEDAWDLAREAFAELPRAVNFISGPSRTGDIEQKMVLGAHGPYRVHIVVMDAG